MREKGIGGERERGGREGSKERGRENGEGEKLLHFPLDFQSDALFLI